MVIPGSSPCFPVADAVDGVVRHAGMFIGRARRMVATLPFVAAGVWPRAAHEFDSSLSGLLGRAANRVWLLGGASCTMGGDGRPDDVCARAARRPRGSAGWRRR